MWWASGERQHVFVDLVVTQQGLRLEVKVGRQKGLKREVSGGGWPGVVVAPAPRISHHGVKRVIKRELVRLSTRHPPHALIGWTESALCLAASC